MIDGNELLRRFLKNSIEKPVDEAHIDELMAVFLGVLHFYKCLQGHPVPYHDITQFIYNYKTEIRIDDLEMLMSAIELKFDDSSPDTIKCFRKFRRNISLAVTQKYYIQKVAKDALDTAKLAEEIANRASNISGRVNETLGHAKSAAKRAEVVASSAQKLASEAKDQIIETKKVSENMMVNYVTILGIFATIIITVFGGINIIGSTVKLLEGSSRLAYLVFVISFLMICLLTLIRTLTSWVSSLNSFKENKVIVSSPKSFYKYAICSFLGVAIIAGFIGIFSEDRHGDTQKEDSEGKANPSNVLFMNIEK